MKKLLAVDPGLSSSGTGLAVFEGGLLVYNGFINFEPKNSFCSRVHELVSFIKPLFSKGDKMVVEKSFYPGLANILHLKTLGVLEAFFDCDYIAPSTVKKLIAGHGRSTKPEVALGVDKLLSGNECAVVKWKNEDAVDAVAIGLAWRIKNDKVL